MTTDSDEDTASLLACLHDLEQQAAALAAEIATEVRTGFAGMLDKMAPADREVAPRVLPLSVLPDVRRTPNSLRLVSLTRQLDRLRREGRALREKATALTQRSAAVQARVADLRDQTERVREWRGLAADVAAHGRQVGAWEARLAEHQRRATGVQK